MECGMSRLEVTMTPDRQGVVITLLCDDAYEAAVMFDTVSERAVAGSIHMDFHRRKDAKEGTQ